MNIIEILKKLGWNIITANNESHEYTVIESQERLARETEQNGIIYGEITIFLKKVSFNEFGNLYVLFHDKKTNSYVDNYLHNEMEANELYA